MCWLKVCRKAVGGGGDCFHLTQFWPNDSLTCFWPCDQLCLGVQSLTGRPRKLHALAPYLQLVHMPPVTVEGWGGGAHVCQSVWDVHLYDCLWTPSSRKNKIFGSLYYFEQLSFLLKEKFAKRIFPPSTSTFELLQIAGCFVPISANSKFGRKRRDRQVPLLHVSYSWATPLDVGSFCSGLVSSAACQISSLVILEFEETGCKCTWNVCFLLQVKWLGICS